LANPYVLGFIALNRSHVQHFAIECPRFIHFERWERDNIIFVIIDGSLQTLFKKLFNHFK